MALVAYDYDSNSEIEDDEINMDVNKTVAESLLNSANDKLPNKQSEINLFSNLPQTKLCPEPITEDQIEDFIPKSKPNIKEKQKVKITIPALSQFADVNVDEPEIKRVKSSAKSSGLISILPPVKGSVMTAKSFIPNVVANKNQNNDSIVLNSKASTVLIPNALRKRTETKKTVILQKMQQKIINKNGSDLESDDDLDLPESFDDEMWEKVCGRPKPKQIIKEPEPEHEPQKIVNIAPEPEKQYEGLDNKAFKELVGKSKKPVGNIRLIDINEEEILPEKDLWMTKSLTDPEMAPKPQIEDPVDPTRRKKHHITYLAQQAKANEQELQNTWAASKNNRMATRAKYGF